MDFIDPSSVRIPDVVLAADRSYTSRRPSAADVHLLIEVAWTNSTAVIAAFKLLTNIKTFARNKFQKFSWPVQRCFVEVN